MELWSCPWFQGLAAPLCGLWASVELHLSVSSFTLQASRVPFNSETPDPFCSQLQDNKTFLAMLNSVLSVDGFYFSTTYDLTHTLQRLSNTSPEFQEMSLLERVSLALGYFCVVFCKAVLLFCSCRFVFLSVCHCLLPAGAAAQGSPHVGWGSHLPRGAPPHNSEFSSLGLFELG